MSGTMIDMHSVCLNKSYIIDELLVLHNHDLADSSIIVVSKLHTAVAGLIMLLNVF